MAFTLLLENGDKFLLESGDDLLLEGDGTVTIATDAYRLEFTEQAGFFEFTEVDG